MTLPALALTRPTPALTQPPLTQTARPASEPVARVVDTTGAGDSFAAGYLWRRLAHTPVEAAVALGNRLARIVIQHPGAIVPRAAMAGLLADEAAGAAR